MTKDSIVNKYFDWLCSLVYDRSKSRKLAHRKLLMYLHNTEFRYSIPNDGNRAADGIGLRSRFADECEIPEAESYLDGPCSVLEMMIALAVRCEVHIMNDPDIGDRTGQWFWDMVSNLGLGSMTDGRFDKEFVTDKVARFLDREYERNGEGGLFKLEHCQHDLRDVEIWYQMCWYLDSIL